MTQDDITKAKMDGADWGMAVLFAILIPFLLVWRGYSIVVLWAWFVVPVFAIADLSIAQAVGLFLVARYILLSVDLDKNEGKEKKSVKDRCRRSIILGVSLPALMMALAWPITWCL